MTYFSLLYFNGSYPPFEKGLHLKILFIPSHVPFIEPYLLIACFVLFRTSRIKFTMYTSFRYKRRYMFLIYIYKKN